MEPKLRRPDAFDASLAPATPTTPPPQGEFGASSKPPAPKAPPPPFTAPVFAEPQPPAMPAIKPLPDTDDKADFYKSDVPSAPASPRSARERRKPGTLAEDLPLGKSQAYHGNPERTRLISKMGKAINGAWKDSLFGKPSIPTNAESAERSWNDGLAILQNQVPQAQSALVESILSGTKKEQEEAQARYQSLRNQAHDLMDATIGYTMAADERP